VFCMNAYDPVCPMSPTWSSTPSSWNALPTLPGAKPAPLLRTPWSIPSESCVFGLPPGDQVVDGRRAAGDSPALGGDARCEREGGRLEGEEPPVSPASPHPVPPERNRLTSEYPPGLVESSQKATALPRWPRNSTFPLRRRLQSPRQKPWRLDAEVPALLVRQRRPYREP
jgi:hypothetical protein